MAQFALEAQISAATTMAGAVRGPLQRWQRRNLDSTQSRLRNMSLSDSQLNMLPPSPGRINAKTPRTPKMKRPTGDGLNSPKVLTPSRCRSMESLTPGRKGSRNGQKLSTGKTPKGKIPISGTENVNPSQDRFIPSRSATDFERAHHIMKSNLTRQDSTDSQSEETNKMADALGADTNSKILSYQNKCPTAKDGGRGDHMRVLYTGGNSSAVKTAVNTRHIPKQAEKILDAPGILDDYYLNLLSWSSTNEIALALSDTVYIWSGETGAITQLPPLTDSEEYIGSLSWTADGNILAVGNSFGAIQIWDVGAEKLIRTMGGHSARVSSLAWNSYIVSSGSRSGMIHHHDVRVAEHHQGTLNIHTQEVCGLAWSPDGRHLASGANDNLVCIWDATLSHEASTPLHTFNQHCAAVKALAWCPWHNNLLATGGGTADRHIRFWNVTTGACLQSVDTCSQVSGIVWSKQHKEIMSSHGYSLNQLRIWKYPTMAKVIDLTGHEQRILGIVASPDGTMVASVSADETFRIWECFQNVKTVKAPKVKSTTGGGTNVLARAMIR